MKTPILAAALALAATSAFADPEKYTMDPSHSQMVVTYDHAGFSKTFWLLSGFEGEVMFDAENPAASSVTTSFDVGKALSGWEDREGHILKSGSFFDLGSFPDLTFTSTGIEVTGDDTALITGALTLNGVTKDVVLDATLNTTSDAYPFPPNDGKPAIGLNATASLLRSEFNLGLYAPYVGDQLDLDISIEAVKLN